MKPSRLQLLVLFFLSGASSLIFENLWQRSLVLEFGSAATATNAVLTSFFVGLALGGYFGGKILMRLPSAVAFYGACEVGIALFGLSVPALLAGIHLPYSSLAASAGPGTFFGFLIRFVSAIVVTLPATFCMGATIPAMNRILAEYRGTIGTSVALALGLNTVGAVIGCLLPGLVLLPALGVGRSYWVAAGASLAIGSSALVLSRFARRRSDSLAERPVAETHVATAVLHPNLLAVAYFAAAASALGYEILWFRVLAIYSTGSWLTFALVLSVYLFGFGFGSLLIYPICARRLDARTIFCLSNLGVGAATLCLIPLAYLFPLVIERFTTDMQGGGSMPFAQIVLVELIFAIALVLVPSLFLGLAYPSVCSSLTGTIRDIAPTSGGLYFLGNLGSAVGVLFVGLLVIPMIGLPKTVSVLCIGSVLLAALIAVREQRLAVRFKGIGAIVFCALLLGAAAFAGYSRPFTKLADNSAILRYRAGTTGTVTVAQGQAPGAPPYRVLIVDGHAVAGTNMSAAIDAKMLAHIPLMLHPQPRRALTVGFGSGGTSWSLTRYAIAAECVEIEPEVVRSAGLFREQNNGVLGEPNFRLILNDARDYLMTTDARYDVIATDVTQLQYKQNSSLYTREYFGLMKQRLTPDGIACAWVPMVGITKDEFRTLLRTFKAVFPHSTMWYMNHSATDFGILIGTPGPLAIDMNRLEASFAQPDIASDLNLVGVQEPLQIVQFLHLDEEGFRRFAGEGNLHTDDRPTLEFSSAFVSPSKIQFVDIVSAAAPLHPKSYRGVVRNWPGKNLESLDQYALSSSHMTQAIAKFYEGEYSRDNRQAATHYREATRLARKALGPVRNDIARMFWFNEMMLALNHAEASAGIPSETPAIVADDFDGELRLPLYPQVGAARPVENSFLVQDWGAKMRELVEKSRFVPGAGRDGSTAFHFAAPTNAPLAGFFSPQPVEPGGLYDLSFWLKAEMDDMAEAGIMVVEFRERVLSGEQVPDVLLRDMSTAIQGPFSRSGTFNWQHFSAQLQLKGETQMIHLIILLKDETGKGRVWLDDVKLQRLK